MKKFLSIFALALVALAAMATEQLTICDANNTSNYVPFWNLDYQEPGMHSQFIYPAEMLTAMNGMEINSVTFYVQDSQGLMANGGKLIVKIGETDIPIYSSATDFRELHTELTTMPVEPGATELLISFSAPYEYQGGNLVFDFTNSEVGGDNWFGWNYWYGMNQGSNYTAIGSNGSLAAFLPKATFTFEGGGGEEPGITLLSEANALEDNSEFTFNGDAVVTANKNGYLFLREESGFSMITDVTPTFENGQVLSRGWSATKTSLSNGWVRYSNAANLSASGETDDELAAPIVLMTKPTDDSMLNAYVLIEKTTISSGGGFGPGLPGHAVQYTLPDKSKINETQMLWAFDGEAGNDLYNVYGIVCKDGNTYKIQPVKFEKYVEPVEEWDLGDVNHDHSVDVNDVTMMISYILGNDPEPFYLTEANVDGDAEGAIDVNDVTSLIAIILNAE